MLLLEAVDRPELQHLKNVVVFPSKGKRPHPNEASGSDLDGDVYWVCYNSKLVPPKQGQPMEFPSSKSEKQDKSFVKVLEFFLNYMENNNLGMISNAHVRMHSIFLRVLTVFFFF